MAVTGYSTDGAIVFDDAVDDRGRLVIDATNRILSDGTHYIELTAAIRTSQQGMTEYRDSRRR